MLLMSTRPYSCITEKVKWKAFDTRRSMLFVSIGNIGSMIDHYSKEPRGNALLMSLARRRGK